MTTPFSEALIPGLEAAGFEVEVGTPVYSDDVAEGHVVSTDPDPGSRVLDGDTVTLGSHTLNVHHCPGHTPGHVVFYSPELKRAFVGDVLFAGSIGRTDFPRGNHAQLIDSIRGKLFPLGDDITFVPGHGQTSTFGWERKTNSFVADLLFDDEEEAKA